MLHDLCASGILDQPALSPPPVAEIATGREPASTPDRHRRALRSRLRHLAKRYRGLRDRHNDLLRELCLAEGVQRGLLPRQLPVLAGARFAAAWRPYHHLAGDFYNVFRLDRHKVGFYIGDVMGHGPAAALLTIYAMCTIRTKHIEGSHYEIIEPAEVLGHLSASLLHSEAACEHFLTMTYGVLDLEHRVWTYSTGGHPPPFLLRAGREPRVLTANSPLLGVVDMEFGQDRLELEPGDRLLLYTDGAEQATWGTLGHGIEGMQRALTPRPGLTINGQIDQAMAASRFEADAPGDDLTLLGVDLETLAPEAAAI